MYPKTAKFTLPGFILIVLGVFSFFSGCASTGEGESGTETVVYQEDFEAYDGSWKSRGDASLDITSDKAHGGTNSLHISGRSKTWHGAIYSLSGRNSG